MRDETKCSYVNVSMTCANHDHIFTTSVFRKIIGDNISIIHLRIIVDYFIAIMIYDNTSVAKIFLKRNVQKPKREKHLLRAGHVPVRPPWAGRGRV